MLLTEGRLFEAAFNWQAPLRLPDGGEGTSGLVASPSFGIAAGTAPFLGTLFARAGDIDSESPALKLLVMKLFDCFIGFLGRLVFDKGIAARFSGHFVEH